jgi:predicted nucleic acid-binding protein
VIVLDSSAAVEYLLASEIGEWVEAQLVHVDRVHAPYLLDIEVTGALRKQVLLGEVSYDLAEQALSDFRDLRVRRYRHLPFLERIWELRHNLTAPDAAFVALTEALGASLVTTDLSLASAPGLRVSILTP